MKLNKLFLGLLGLTAMVMSSCSDKDDYQWATASGEQVYFSNELPTTQEISLEASSFTIPVSRVNTNSAITVPVTITSDDNFYSAPSSISFNSGEAKANLTISYDPTQVAYDDYKTVKVTLGEEYTTPYGNSTYTFKSGIASPYKAIGKGSITDNFWFEATTSVTIMQNTQNKYEFRIMNPFPGLAKAAQTSIDGNESPYIQLTLLQPGDTFYEVPITQKDLVGYTDICTGYFHSSYEADVYMLFPGRLSKYAAEEYFVHNRVVEWQENGLPGRIQLAPYFYMFGVGGWDNTQADGVVVIDFPGYAPKDLTVEMDYLGVLTDADGGVNATVNLALGADVNDARAIVVSADSDPDAVADAIAAGDLEATPVVAGYNFIPVEEGLTGKLMVVVVVLDEGAVKGVVTKNFEYYGGGKNPWESLGEGLMVDNLFITMYSPDGESYYEPMALPVEILENTDEPGLYRLVDPYQPYAEAFGVDYETTYLEVNATDPEGVYILMQPTGVDDGDGMTYLCSYGGYMLEDYDFATLKEYGYFGTLVDGLITLPQFPVKDDDGNVKYTFQGVFAQGSGAWRTGMDSEFQLYLPGAVPAEARKAAASKLKAMSFARRMFGKKSSRDELRKARKLAILSHDQVK